jgi:hypothetical protein
MPFFHRITILLYQSKNNIASAVFRCAAERREEKGTEVLSCVKNRRRFNHDGRSVKFILHVIGSVYQNHKATHIKNMFNKVKDLGFPS